MVTFAQAAAREYTEWVVILTIEGIGTHDDGIYKFCSRVPQYASGLAQYKDWLHDWPDHLAENAPEKGGVAELGDVSFELLDESDSLTSAFRIQANATTALNMGSGLSASATTVTVRSATSIAVNSIIYVGNEAMKVGAKAGNDLTVTRGALGTDAFAHPDGALAYLYTPYLVSRRVRYYLAPYDGDDTSSTTEKLQGDFRLESLALTHDHNVWTIGAKSQLKHASRVVAKKSRRFEVWMTFPDPTTGVVHSFNVRPSGRTLERAPSAHWPTEDVWLKVGDEILLAPGDSWTVRPRRNGRGRLGTAIETEIKEGSTEVVQVLAADTSGPCSFRYSASSATSRASNDWTESAHFVDIILCLLTSSADGADGLELTNYNSTYGNWSSLPVGFGVGMPHADIDWASFLDVKLRTLDWVFPNFWMGDDQESFVELISRHFLRPLGAYLTVRDGKLALILPRSPVADQTGTSVGVDDLLRREVEEGVYAIDAEHALDIDLQTSAVTYKVSQSGGRTAELTVTNEDYEAHFGQSGYYGLAERAETFDLPSLRADEGGTEPLIEQLALRHLYRHRFPPQRLKFATHVGLYAIRSGEIMSITCPEFPDFANGTRGWTSVLGIPFSRELRVGPDTGRGASFEWRAHVYASSRSGRVSASAVVRAVSGPDVDGNYTATVYSSLYTLGQAGDASLPTNDAQAFAATHVAKLINSDGSSASGSTATVVAVTSTTVKLNGSFGGAMAADTILIFTNHASAVSAQTNAWVFYADVTNQNVGSSSEVPWRYAEP